MNDFNKVAKTPLEEWIYYLNTGEIPETAHAPGLAEVRERLKVDGMTKGEREAYYRHLDNIVILRNNIYTERAEGRAEGRMEGRAEGRMEGRAERRACQGFGDSPQVKRPWDCPWMPLSVPRGCRRKK